MECTGKEKRLVDEEQVVETIKELIGNKRRSLDMLYRMVSPDEMDMIYVSPENDLRITTMDGLNIESRHPYREVSVKYPSKINNMGSKIDGKNESYYFYDPFR